MNNLDFSKYQYCKCGNCNELIPIRDKRNRPIKYKKGHHHFKYGRIKNYHGYIMIYDPRHPFSNKQGYIFEHRIIMENKLNRYLLPNEDIHHINEIRDDNRIENLLVLTHGQHSSLTNSRHNLKDHY